MEHAGQQRERDSPEAIPMEWSWTDAVAARRRLAFLDELSALLATTFQEPEMLANVTRLAVPTLGDWAGVFAGVELAAEAGPPSHGAAVLAHLRADPQRRLASVVAGEGPFVVTDFPLGSDAEREVGAAALVPLAVDGRALGAFAVATDAGRGLALEALALIGEVARRTAFAMEHARLLRDAHLAARAREEFLQIASHELRGPIGTLRLAVGLLQRDARAGVPPAFEARLRVVDRQAQRLVRLSETLLDVSRITAGRLELVREEADLAGLAREVASRYADEASDAGSTLNVDAPAPVHCAFDSARMDQVLSNLVSNAVKYGRGGPIRVRVRAEGERVVAEVEDHGIGIATEDRERIFGRFERAVSGRNFGGLGLGLWIARALVEAHGGTIGVTSASGEGSTFRVELPGGR